MQQAHLYEAHLQPQKIVKNIIMSDLFNVVLSLSFELREVFLKFGHLDLDLVSLESGILECHAIVDSCEFSTLSL